MTMTITGDHHERVPLPRLEHQRVPRDAGRHGAHHPTLPLHHLAGLRGARAAADTRQVTQPALVQSTLIIIEM